MTKRIPSTIFIPYKINDGVVSVFFQRRTKDARILPDYYAFFGGKIEANETAEQTLIREIREELNFSLSEFTYLGEYTFENSYSMLAFCSKFDDTFEHQITVMEGQYGKWLSTTEVSSEQNIHPDHQKVLLEFFKTLR